MTPKRPAADRGYSPKQIANLTGLDVHRAPVTGLSFDNVLDAAINAYWARRPTRTVTTTPATRG